ncbi:hypothetical protein [Ekhidna sp. To15]|uniref:hypothetical protein n=1 Tax=Ekhidna sp. To15 TaxID=3395267 RepID=UPI003F51F2CC
MNKTLLKPIAGLFIACLLTMLWSYQSGYDNAIDWEVTTTGEIIEFPAWSLETDLMTHEIKGEKFLLSERYTGSEIKRDISQDRVFMSLMWIGLCVVLVASTYLKRYAFFIVVALFALFLNRLNLFEIGLFGIQTKMIIFIPALVLIVPMIVFHEYKKTTPLLVRVVILLALSIGLLFGVDNGKLFTDHLIANSLYGFAICTLFFLFIIAEEISFSILYVVTSGKGGKNNHVHFLILSLIYLGNLILHYLNKSGLYENSFFFFDPFILLTISALVSLWSLKFKSEFISNYLSQSTLYLLTLSLGIISLSFISHNMVRGNDAVYQAFHYFILYFHIGFGVLFFLYIIGNFIDPLIQGMQIHKIAFKERNFPYASARLGGFFAILAFYFLSDQEPFNLLKAGYYNYQAQVAETEGNVLLANEYTLEASNLGYNTHYANYKLGWRELKKGAEYPAKTYFFSAAQRYPSPYALINYGNLDLEINANKVQAIYEESFRGVVSGEVQNNLGLLHIQKGELEKSLTYFEEAKPLNDWNNAPLVNKWNVFKKMELIDSSSIELDYRNGNYGVKSNILTTQTPNTSLSFEYENISGAGYLHRQTYLLNSTYLFSHDSVESLTRKEIENSTDGSYNDRLRLALAIHLYRKGEVNEAFMMLDYLQANSHQYYKGQYYDALGKLAMDQEAYKLSLDFFDKALDLKYTQSLFSRLEVLARMDKKHTIPNELLQALKANPELTTTANNFLSKLERYNPPTPKSLQIPVLENLPDTVLVALGRMNAFHEAQVVAVVDELKKREASGGYELLIDATEINPYSPVLLKKYIFLALEWNLVDYAEQTLEKLEGLISKEEFQSFNTRYQTYKEEQEEAAW